jgi:hypothetical protein
VYAWSSSIENPVGAEYIIMERSRGIELSKVWGDLSGPDKFEIVKKLVGFEKSFVSSRFPMYGSLYHPEDLQEVQPNQLVDLKSNEDPITRSVFAVGPTTNRTFFDDNRDVPGIDHGPCKSLFPLNSDHGLCGLY